MKKKHFLISSVFLSIFVVLASLGLLIFSQKGELSYSTAISSKYLAANNIISLNAPLGIAWSEGSSATAKWNRVENANYYIVNLYVYDINEILLGKVETGTSDTEIDLQQEIYSIVKNMSNGTYKLRFDVTGKFIDALDDYEVIGETSILSNYYSYTMKNVTQLARPTELSIDDSYKAQWTSSPNNDYYHFTIRYKYNGKYYEYDGSGSNCSSGSSNRCVANSNSMVTFNLSEFIQAGYKKYLFEGNNVEVSYKVQAKALSENGQYKSSAISEWSNEVTYNNSGVTKLTKPTELSIDDSYKAQWTSSPNNDYYHFTIRYKYNGITREYDGSGSNCSSGSSNRCVANSNSMVTFNLSEFIQAGYKYYNYDNVNVEVSYKVQAKALSENGGYISSDVSEWSNSVNYIHAGAIKLNTPTDINFSNNKVASWKSILNNDYYHFVIRYKYNGKYYEYDGGGSNCSSESSNRCVANSNSMVTFNLSEFIQAGYKYYNISEPVVEVSYKVQAKALSENGQFTSGYASAWSNWIYYSPSGSTIINEINISPQTPIIAVGRSMYLGKTINPSNAIYSKINWSVSNKNILSINNMGYITGITPGKTTVNVQINNASQTVDVNVYEIKSNLSGEDNINIINEANDIIEAVVTDGDISNTDITDKKSVLLEIEQGAENSDKFNVDVKYDDKNKTDYNDIKDSLNNKYSDFEIVGGKDIKIEISHTDSQGTEHHIANILELENEVSLEFDMNSKIPQFSPTKSREYKVVRVHNNSIEEIDFSIKNGVIATASDKFSDFILLYSDTDIPANEISVDKTSVEINVGNTNTINVQVLPENAANRNYSSVSSNTDIATVNKNVITAIAPGNAIITFTSEDGNYSKTVNVTVKLPLTSISLNKTNGIKNVGETETLIVTYNPTNTTDSKNVIWTTSDSNIATVNNGVITAKNPGRATITATVGTKTAIYVLDVKLPLSSISLNKTTGSLIAEKSELLTVTYNPTNTTDDKTITWTTSNPAIATVTDGYVNAISAGNVTITAKVGDKTATYSLTVIPRIKLTSISLNKTTENLNVGQEQTLIVTYNPTDTNDDKTVTWTTSNANIATINNGKVKAVSPGNVTITAKVGDKTATYELTVKQPLTSISLNKTSGSLRVESTEALTVTYNPTNTTDNKTVVWTSSDSTVAKVENGKITALKVGTTTITAKVGNKTATYNLTVVEKETLQEVAVKKGYKVKNSFIHGFKLDDLINNIKSKLGLNVTTNTNSTVIATGVQFKYNDEIFTAVVYGDLNGDGKINSADLLKMRQHLLGTSTLTGAYKEAGSIAIGTTINSADLLRIRQHLLGQKSIEQ